MSQQSEQTPGRAPDGHDAPPGPDQRTPRETGSGEPVDLGDRTAPGASGDGYTGSPVGNQGKAEPMPATPGHPDPAAPLEPPSLASMNVGAADPQSPSHPAAAGHGSPGTPGAAPTDLGGPGTVPSEDRPVVSVGSSTGRATGPEIPASSSIGTSHKAPGMLGTTGPDESVETDVEASAAQMVPQGAPSLPDADKVGDAGGVPVTGHEPAAGTSEEQAAVRGARTPESPPR